VSVPAKPHEFVLYLQYIGETKKSKSPVEEACNAISWQCRVAFVGVTSLCQGYPGGVSACSMLAKPVVKKEPATVEMLEAIVEDSDKF